MFKRQTLRLAQARIGILSLALSWGWVWAGAAHDGPQESLPNRLVLIKSDGLPPELLAAVAMPERTDLVDRLSYAEDLRRAMR
ncbi:MAG: hypothetical protein V3T83_15705, partial [Acidobacteriota bacterium]